MESEGRHPRVMPAFSDVRSRSVFWDLRIAEHIEVGFPFKRFSKATYDSADSND